MKKLVSLFLTILILAALSSGCVQWMRGETTAKCPRCGAMFTIDEEIHMREITR